MEYVFEVPRACFSLNPCRVEFCYTPVSILYFLSRNWSCLHITFNLNSAQTAINLNGTIPSAISTCVDAFTIFVYKSYLNVVAGLLKVDRVLKLMGYLRNWDRSQPETR